MTSAEFRILVKDSAMTDAQKAIIGNQLASRPPSFASWPEGGTSSAIQSMVVSTSGPSALEEKFLALWKDLDGPALEREWRFHQTRQFRFDFAHLSSKTAIECEGGAYKGKGRHFSVTGFTNDAIKYNLATLAGWSVFRLPGQLVNAENIRPIVERTKRYAMATA